MSSMTSAFPPIFIRDVDWILAIVFLRFSGIVSLLSYTVILYMILSDRKVKLKRIHNRIMMMMSCFGIINALGWSLATSPVPRGTHMVYGAIGNRASCSLQGFLLQMGSAVPSYNLAISIYFLLVVRYNIPDARIESRIEPCMHAICTLYPIGTAIAGLALRLYHVKGAMCWIEASPWGCNRVKGIPCTENPHSLLYELAFVGVWFIIIGVGISSIMILIYCTVRCSEQRMKKFNFTTRKGIVSSSNSSISKDRKNTGIQAMLYISSFVFTYVWAILYYVAAVGHGKNADTCILLLFYFFTPLQGLWNLILYIRPRYLVVSEEYPDMTFLWKVKTVIFTPESQRRQSSLKTVKSFSRNVQQTNTTRPIIQQSPRNNRASSPPPSMEQSLFAIDNESHLDYIPSGREFVGDITLNTVVPGSLPIYGESLEMDPDAAEVHETRRRRFSLVSLQADEMCRELHVLINEFE